MYRCKECGTEYEIKPDYCDCGNDEFEIFVAPEKKEVVESVQQQKEIRIPQPKFNPQPSVKAKKYSEADRIKQFFDPISTAVFLICLVMAYVTVAYIGNPEPQNPKSEPQKQEVVNVPSVESYWDNTLPSVQQPMSKITAQPVTVKEEGFLQKMSVPIQKAVQPAFTTKIVAYPQKNETQKISPQPQTSRLKSQKQAVSAPAQVKVNQPALVQVNKPPKAKTAVQNSSSAGYSALTQRVQSNAQKSVAAQTQTRVQPAQKVQTSQSASSIPVIRTTSTQTGAVQTQHPTQVQTVVQKAAVDEKALKQEFTSYKVSLRNTIGKKINFTNVVGDGECVVSFKISSSGKLINRQFTQQSSNLTLNNVVYAAVNSTPSFTAPPAGYKNETLNLKVSFYNGNFNISLY